MRRHHPLNKKNRANSAVLISKSGKVISLSALFVMMGCFFLIGSAYAQSTLTWDGGGDGTTWTDSANWDPYGVPTSSDSVIIGNNGRVEINSNKTQDVGSLLLKDGAHLNITTNSSAQTSLLAGDGSGTHNAIEIQEGTILEVDGGDDKSVAIASGSEKFYNDGTYIQTAGTGLGDDNGNPLPTSRQTYTSSSTFKFYLDGQYFQVQDYGNLHLNPDPNGSKVVFKDSMHVNSYKQTEGSVSMVEGGTNKELMKIDSTFNLQGGVFRIAQDNKKDTVYFEVGKDVIINKSQATFHAGAGYHFEMSGDQEQSLSPLVGSLETFIVSGGGQKNLQDDLQVDTIFVMNGGDVNLNGNTLTLGLSEIDAGTFKHRSGSVLGKFKRWVEPKKSALYLPVGNLNPNDSSIAHHRHADLDFKTMPNNGGSLSLEFIQNNPGYDGLPVYEDDDTLKNIGTTGFWRFQAADGLGTDNYIYNIKLTASDFVDVFDTNTVHTVIRDDSNSDWELRGNHKQSGSNGKDLIIYRNDLTGFSDFTASGEEDNPLPVEFTDANIVTSNSRETATIKWQTATETENYRFYIDRAYVHGVGEETSRDTNWSQIGYREGQGTTSNTHNYSYEDNGLSKAGKYAYRIRQIDYDGTVTVLTTLDLLLESPGRTDLKDNYPNPFNPLTQVPYKLAESGQVNVKVYNTLGQQVATLVDEYQEAGQYEVRFNASSLSSGIYFIRLKANGYSVNRSVTLIK